jgi:hypothetical protein
VTVSIVNYQRILRMWSIHLGHLGSLATQSAARVCLIQDPTNGVQRQQGHAEHELSTVRQLRLREGGAHVL